MNVDLKERGDPVLSSSWKKHKVFKKIYSGGKVEYDHHSKILLTLCDGCILAISIEKGPFAVATIGPYNQDETLGSEHSEEVITFGYFNGNVDNRLVLTIGSKGIFRLWKVIIEEVSSVKFEYLRSWKSGQASVAEIEFDPTGQYVSTGGTDGTIQIYDVVGGFTTHQFKSHKSLITKLKFHGKRWLLFSACVEGLISIYDLTTSKTIIETNSHYSVIHSFDLFEVNSESSSLGGLVTAGADNMINVWDLDQIPDSGSVGIIGQSSSEDTEVKSGSKKKRKKDSSTKAEKIEKHTELMPIKQIHSSETAFSLRCAPNELNSKDSRNADHKGNRCPWIILTGNEKSGIQIWNPVTGSSIKSMSPESYNSNQSAVLYMFLDHNEQPSKVHGKEAHRFLILVTEDRNIVILSYPNLDLFTTFFGNTPDFIQLALFTDRGNLEKNEDAPEPHGGLESIGCVILDSTETPQIMSINRYPYFKNPLIGHTSTVLSMDISNCSNLIATGSKDETIRIWSTYNQECLAVLSGHTSLVTALSFQKKAYLSRNTSFYLFSASNDNTLKAWNIASIVPGGFESSPKKSSRKSQNSVIAIHNVIAHKKEINHLSISHNDKFIATCSEDRTIKVWSFPDLKLLGTCKGHTGGVWQSNFSPIEKVIASSSSDSTIKIWNLNTFQCDKTLQGHDGSVLQVDFLGNGLQVISCGSDNLIKLWNVSTGECIRSFSGHIDRIWTLNLLRESSSLSAISEKDLQKSSQSIPNSNAPSGLLRTRFMVTGGSDSQLIFWMDNTKQVEDEKNLENLKKIEDLNEIDMLFNRREYLNALSLSLRQKLQYKTYLILEKLLKPCLNNQREFSLPDSQDKSAVNSDEHFNLRSIIEWIEGLNTSELSALFSFMLEWITISKTVWISNSLMYIILTKIESQKLYKVEGFVQIVQAFRSYNMKIQIHLSSIYQKSYILDYLFLSNQISPGKNNHETLEGGEASDKVQPNSEALGLTLDTLFKN
ncbi:WD repeat-containing protein [Cryptosporidium canis]|uniref:WD repeat-containing protein n=1 Tax=Cryptosporidium canis TaxID=195482 RepID=A0A9D5DMA4_9CRYT|nr:WD repeat-containing protein [Cryptosporidium canis]